MKTIEQLTQELEAVKKERAKWEQECLDWKKDCEDVIAQRDKAVKLLEQCVTKLDLPSFASTQIKTFLSRLSSGETKSECKMCSGKRMVGHMTTEGGETWPCPECCPSNNSFSLERCLEVFNTGYTCGIMFQLGHPGYEREDVKSRMRSSIITEIRTSNNSSSSLETNQPEIPVSSSASSWISVEDRLPEKRKNKGHSKNVMVTDRKQWCRTAYNHRNGYWLCSFNPSHWRDMDNELPAPPESLTDKTK